ncbi:hypothetical protein NP92_04560 [Anoxybacillus gonensis]|uniref:Uncharacterized protein n=1 Tax=Anoxybacillus gonensis TaxID=198467 RepID=A0AAW7TCM3_9BACL|nr:MULTISPECIES: hypothetical protein [Anoxybacillus]AXM89410.1 hypothetical protein B379_09865 [Anoxybacillus ayderensis G10]THD16798.1 hypothetical protein CI793_07375 [Anoxybacillus ayderensis]AKS39310.1 hypothetical protein AFK25_12100 [Anoxybacillus gonensis]EMI10791.1 hypothetical protein F510_1172 [Anoxybacillus gonensis]KGP61023.1 hypothetical protein NP92_04560 [Anoxybacillus gonensis]
MFNPELYFYYILLITLLIFTYLFYRRTKNLSKTLLMTITALFFVSIVCSISLALNYYQSLKPNTEGIGISNVIAYWLLGEDAWAPVWTIQLFKKAYSISLWITLILFVFLIILLFMKRKESE